MSPERLEELYQTEMDEESKNIWANCVEWLVNYFHCSKQLADIRIREWNREYQHCPIKTVGLTSINKSELDTPYNNSTMKSSGVKAFDDIII